MSKGQPLDELHRWNKQDLDLLKEAVSLHRPELLPLLDILGVTELMTEQREDLRHAVSDDFSANDNPNARDLLLEELIDLLGHS